MAGLTLREWPMDAKVFSKIISLADTIDQRYPVHWCPNDAAFIGLPVRMFGFDFAVHMLMQGHHQVLVRTVVFCLDYTSYTPPISTIFLFFKQQQQDMHEVKLFRAFARECIRSSLFVWRWDSLL